MSDNSYTAKDIQILEGLEPVRKRPGMYIGSTDIHGLHELVKEIIDNSVDEALAGFAKNVWVIIDKNEKITVVTLIQENEKPYIVYELLGGSPADLLLPRNFLIVEGKSDLEFFTRVLRRFYFDKPLIQIIQKV